MSLTPGTRLGVYEIVGAIGSGGMGEVYRAVHSRLRREVAIKVLPPELAADEGGLARFVREARTASALNHPAHEAGIVHRDIKPAKRRSPARPATCRRSSGKANR